MFALRVLAWAMVLFVMSPAYADRVLRSQDMTGPLALRITEEPCKHEAILDLLSKLVPEPWGIKKKDMKSGLLTWNGKDWQSCWFEYRGQVFSMDEAGDAFNSGRGINKSEFKDESI